jgi:hypothetical protein
VGQLPQVVVVVVVQEPQRVVEVVGLVLVVPP